MRKNNIIICDMFIIDRNWNFNLILKELGKVLGQTDADSQVNEIEVTESFLNMQIEKAEEARKKNQKMYKTLGVVVGLVFVIILI